MSNPGVITLTEKKIGTRRTFRVEDNLGESIHIHYNDIRIDLTIRELLELGDICDDTIYDLVKAPGFNLDDFNYNFLMRYSGWLIDLKKVSVKNITVKDLKYLTKDRLGLPVIKKISSSKRYGRGNLIKKEDTLYRPVMFNNDNVLVYGIDEALQLFLEKPDAIIEVLQLQFENNKHSVPNMPWLDYLFHWDRKRLKNVGYRIAKKIF